jgi:thiol-disulfide isomerase/thioredoxin
MRPFVVGLATIFASGIASSQAVVRVPLEYRAPVDGQPKPNFSPKGEAVSLSTVLETSALPSGAARPARTGMVKVGPNEQSWLPILVTADSAHPTDLTTLYVDRNRNGDFSDDGAPLTATPSQNAKTKAWWTSINKVEFTIPYGAGSSQPYLVNFWSVRDDSAGVPDVIRYSVGSWREGTGSVNGVPVYVAMMDDNDALFTRQDMWAVLATSDSAAATRVLRIDEARGANRLMFVSSAKGEQAVEFRNAAPDGSWIEFAPIVRAGLTKASDRNPDDLLKDERPRPRTSAPVTWNHGSSGLETALASAKASGKRIILDFEATWCGPCHTMDQWIWNDAEVAAALNAGYVGVKIDVDLEPKLVKRFKTTGYPTMIILDSGGKEIKRVADYQSSAQMLALLR